jgi:hypothetical protein
MYVAWLNKPNNDKHQKNMLSHAPNITTKSYIRP